MHTNVLTRPVAPPRGLTDFFAQLLLWCAVVCLAACGGGSSSAPDVSITTQPSDLSVVEGSTAEFTVGATGDVVYQWQRQQGGTWANVSGATTARLSFGPTQLSDHGSQFRVAVTSAGNAANTVTSSAVTLSVTLRMEAPSVLVQPANQATSAGLDVSFFVTAAGTELGYQWQRGAAGAAWSDIAGAIAVTYTLTAPSEADNAALFRVLVTNSAGSVGSEAARLTVTPAQAAPIFTADPKPVSAAAGQSAVFSATATGTPSPTLSWQSSTDGSTWTDVAGASGGSLTIATVSMADNGKRYRSLASNTSGTVNSAAAQLSVTPQPAAPVIISAPQPVLTGSGATATFAVSASGVPSVSYQWQVSIDGGASFANINGAVQATYTFGAASVTDSGKQFRVVVTNTVGSINSVAATLTVLAPPAITLQPTAQAWRPGLTDALFTTSATGTDLRYQWQISAVAGGAGPFFPVAGATGSSYLHAAGASPQAKSVRVVVSNLVASATSEAAPLTNVTWRYANPQPTGDFLFGLAWSDASTVFAVAEAGTILRSTDAGQTWALASESAWGSGALQDIAFNGNVGIAVGDDGTIKRTEDGGQHWVVVATGNTLPLYGVAFSGPGTATAVGSGGLLRTTDGGAHWVVPTSDVNDVTLSKVSFSSDGVGLAVGFDGLVLRSINGGANWTRVRSGSESLLSVAFATPSVVVAASGNLDSAFLRSTDAGLTWQAVASGIPEYITAVHFGSATVGVATTAFGPVLRTTDGGLTWTSLPSSVRQVTRGVKFGDANQVVVVGSYGVIRRSTDGGATWASAASGPTADAYDLAFASTLVGVSVGRDGAISRTVDSGATWTSVSTSSTVSLQAVAFPNTVVGIAVGQGGLVLRTANAGASWTTINTGLFPQSYNDVAFASPTVGVIAGVSGMLRTTDAGVTWQAVAGVSTSTHHVAFGDAQTGVALGNGGTLLRTTDAGMTWSRVDMGTTVEFNNVAFASPNTVLAVGTGMVARSTDGGVTWATIPFPQYADYAFNSIHFVSPTLGFAVGEFGTVMVTRDGGLTWAPDLSQRIAALTAVASAGIHRVIAVGPRGIVLRNTSF